MPYILCMIGLTTKSSTLVKFSEISFAMTSSHIAAIANSLSAKPKRVGGESARLIPSPSAPRGDLRGGRAKQLRVMP